MSERREPQIFIHAPGLRLPHRRAGDQLLTFIMWAIYAYLWLPLISLIAWFLGIDLFYQEMVVNGGFDAFVDLSAWYLLIIGLILLTVGAWSLSNYLRFHDKERRRPQPPASDEEVQSWFGIDAEIHENLRAARRMRLSFDSQGRLIDYADLPIADTAASESP